MGCIVVRATQSSSSLLSISPCPPSAFVAVSSYNRQEHEGMFSVTLNNKAESVTDVFMLRQYIEPLSRGRGQFTACKTTPRSCSICISDVVIRVRYPCDWLVVRLLPKSSRQTRVPSSLDSLETGSNKSTN